ncbi:MAG: hypothetical protein LBR36_08860 [Bacteroidales bacterium]|jgi:hypothetical protein|nr:hypothetical protein [Bacteroidales bacterium]
MKLNGIIKVVLLLCNLVLGFLIYRSIMRPQKFQDICQARRTEVIGKLTTIRALQSYYKQEYGSYAKSFDQLKDFWNNGKVTIVKKEGSVPDTLTEEQALKMKLIRRDTMRVSAKEEIQGKDTLFRNFNVDAFDIVPYSGGEKFEIDADTIKRSNIPVYVYQVTAFKRQYLNDIDNDPRVKSSFLGNLLFNNLQGEFLGKNFDFREDVKDVILGSMTEPSTDGNWEKL